jgi:hypothetical protein
MIRSRAMRDFRRRERLNNINAFRNLGEGQTLDVKDPSENVSQGDLYSSSFPGAPGKKNQRHGISHPSAQHSFESGNKDIAHVPGSFVPSSSNPSAAASWSPPYPESSFSCDSLLSGPDLLDTASISAAFAVSSSSSTPNSTDPPQQRSRKPSTVVACRSKVATRYQPRAVVPWSSQGRYSCETCRLKSASCSICAAYGSVERSNPQDFAMTAPTNHDVSDWNSIGRPTYSVSSPSSRDPVEQMALQYFRAVVAKDVSGIISMGFWENMVPQMCQMEDTARWIAVALSQAHLERATMRVSHGQNSLQSNSGSTLSTESELKASRALRKYIETSPSPSYELVLTCSIIFHTLESMFGRETSAILHLENALKMFKAWQVSRKQMKLRGNDSAMRSLSTVLARLDVSLTIESGNRIPVFEHDDTFPAICSDEALIQNLRFTNARDAHYQLTRISTPAAAFAVQNHRWHGKNARSVPSHIMEVQQVFRRQFRAWDMAREIYESARSCYSRACDRRAETMSLLATRIVHWCGRNVLEEFVRDDDAVRPWDRTPQKLLTFASDLINHMEEARLAGGHSSHNSFGKS